MYIPVIQKIQFKNDVLLERALPVKGYLTVKVGDSVQPFTKLGMSKVSYKKVLIGEDFKVTRNKKIGGYFYEGEKVGTAKSHKFYAPFSGYLQKEGNDYVFWQEERDFWLLSGAWGTIIDIVKDKSVLIKTPVTDIKFACSTMGDISGELIVFPNPEEALIKEYFENLSKSMFGKIIYVGEFLSTDVLKRAIELGVLGLMAGGADKASLTLAKESGIFLGLFTGFGQVSVPHQIFEILRGVSSRFIFISGKERLLRIPSPENFKEGTKDSTGSTLKKLAKGIEVIVLQKPYFGKIGIVDSVSESSIFVRFSEKEETVQVFIPNVLALQ